jgi:mitochondrial inner membrane protease subunit 1
VIAVEEGDGVFSSIRYVKIPAGHVWLEGDNPRQSTDSRTYGPVPMGLLKGKVILKIFPSFKIIQ